MSKINSSATNFRVKNKLSAFLRRHPELHTPEEKFIYPIKLNPKTSIVMREKCAISFTTVNFLNDIFGNNKDVLARIKVSLKCRLEYSRAATNLMVRINFTV